MPLVFGLYGFVFTALSIFAFRVIRGGALRARVSRSEEQSNFVRYVYLGGPVSLALTVVMFGVVSVALLATRGSSDLGVIAAGFVGVAGTWAQMVGAFAVEHMRGWAHRGGIAFPGTDEPRFSDFMYLSVQMSATFSSGDVIMKTTSARKLASIQAVAGFAYNAFIIAVSASLLLSLAG